MNRKILYSLFIIFILFFSCKKDKDETKPTIIVTAPSYLQQINAVDNVQIIATISDDRNIERVTVSLRDDNDIVVLSTITKKPNTKDYYLNIFYEMDNIHMLSGEYYFDISASDGENTTHKYITVFVNDVVKVREGMFVISNSGSMSDIYYLDNTYNASSYVSVSGDYLGAAVNSYDQQLLHVSSIFGSLTSINLKTGSTKWNIPIISSPPIPYYMGFLYDNQNIYMGLRNGVVQGYDNNGSPNYSAGANPSHYVESSLVHENNYYVTEQRAISGGSVDLVLYWMASGAMVQQSAINEDIKGVYSQTSSTIVLLTNDVALNGKLTFYDIPSGLTSSPFAINVGQIDDCLEISAGVYLVAEGGDITLINANSWSKSSYLTGTGANKIWYDELTNELFVANGNSLDIYDYSSKNFKGNYIHTGVIKDVVFWYNK